MIASLLLAFGGACGVERWAVKTMTDADAAKVELAPVKSSIAQLARLRAPARSRENGRAKAERRVVTVEGHVVAVKTEADRDLHVVLADDDGYTKIIEFPDRRSSVASKSRDDGI
jgi:hypothetical protein